MSFLISFLFEKNAKNNGKEHRVYILDIVKTNMEITNVLTNAPCSDLIRNTLDVSFSTTDMIKECVQNVRQLYMFHKRLDLKDKL